MHPVGKTHPTGMTPHCPSQERQTCPDVCVIYSVCIHQKVSNERQSAGAQGE